MAPGPHAKDVAGKPQGFTAAALVAWVPVDSNLRAQLWLHDDGTETNRTIFRLMDE